MPGKLRHGERYDEREKVVTYWLRELAQKERGRCSRLPSCERAGNIERTDCA
ncbi:MAG: hypothetical protein ACLPSH_11230 [Vulcanimicrobiaceae bacterium]